MFYCYFKLSYLYELMRSFRAHHKYWIDLGGGGAPWSKFDDIMQRCHFTGHLIFWLIGCLMGVM